MTRPSLGMDHPHYEYLPLPARPRLMWPNGAPLAISIYLYLEYWAMEQGAGRVRDPRYNRRSFPDVLHHTWFEHGNRIDIFRVLDALSKHGFKISVATNAMAAERYTALIERLAAYNVEFVAHGLSATEMLNSRMNEHEERAFIDSSITRLAAATGIRPKGWISQDYGHSARTPQLLRKAALQYCADWPNDDQPYWMSGNDLVSIPNHLLWNDLHILWDRDVPVARYPELVTIGAQRLYQEGENSGRFMSIGIHPWILGAAHRIKYLEDALAQVARLENVWFATAGQVAAHYAEHTPVTAVAD